MLTLRLVQEKNHPGEVHFLYNPEIPIWFASAARWVISLEMTQSLSSTVFMFELRDSLEFIVISSTGSVGVCSPWNEERSFPFCFHLNGHKLKHLLMLNMFEVSWSLTLKLRNLSWFHDITLWNGPLKASAIGASVLDVDMMEKKKGSELKSEVETTVERLSPGSPIPGWPQRWDASCK